MHLMGWPARSMTISGPSSPLSQEHMYSKRQTNCSGRVGRYHLTKAFSVCVIATICYSCNLYDLEELYDVGLKELEFDCYGGYGEYYLNGTVGDDSVCIFHGTNGYKAHFGIGNGFVTLSPTFILGELQTQDSKSFISLGMHKKSEINNFLDEFRVKGPPQKFGTSLDSMVRVFLVEGIHPIRGKVGPDSISINGFEILINKWYHNPDLNPDTRNISMTSALGEQPPDSHFTIREVFLGRNGEYIDGFILFDVRCNMYLRNAGPDLDGRFAKDFSGSLRLPVRYKQK